MRLKGLMEPLLENIQFQNTIKSIEDGNYPIEITGLSESGRAYFINGIYEQEDKSIFIFTKDRKSVV